MNGLREWVPLLLLTHSLQDTVLLLWRMSPHSPIWKQGATLALHQPIPHPTRGNQDNLRYRLLRIISDSKGELKDKAGESRRRAHSAQERSWSSR